MTPEQTVSQIRQKDNVVVLLIAPGDELSARAQKTLLTQESRLRSRGFQVSILEMGAKTHVSEELACVRFPQLRFFLRGKMQHKIVGIFDDAQIDAALHTLV